MAHLSPYGLHKHHKQNKKRFKKSIKLTSKGVLFKDQLRAPTDHNLRIGGQILWERVLGDLDLTAIAHHARNVHAVDVVVHKEALIDTERRSISQTNPKPPRGIGYREVFAQNVVLVQQEAAVDRHKLGLQITRALVQAEVLSAAPPPPQLVPATAFDHVLDRGGAFSTI